MTTKEVKRIVAENRDLTRRVEELEEKVKKSKQQAREQSQKLKKNAEQLEKLKQKKREVEKELKKKNKVYGIISQTSIERHKYTDLMVTLCLELYSKCNVSFRTVSDILHILNSIFKWRLEDIPCPNSVENWVKKSGYMIYHDPRERETGKDYAEIIDESMMPGSEKMLLTLGVNAEKKDRKALQKKDVSVLNISVASVWNSAGIEKELERTEEKVGRAPLYVISDNDVKLKKAIRGRKYVHIRDTGHTLALLVEQVYAKSGRFTKYIKALSAVKIREVMRSTGYLLPPAQRSIARFMNLSGVIDWSKQILKIQVSHLVK